MFLYFQFNVSLFAQSTYNLEFNLYPLKAGWQNLPEFILKYNTKEDIPGKRQDDQLNLELQSLVERWMPKKVFILVSIISAILTNNFYIILQIILLSLNNFPNFFFSANGKTSLRQFFHNPHYLNAMVGNNQTLQPKSIYYILLYT